VERIRECHDVGPAGNLASKLQGRLNRIGACRSRKLQLKAQATRPKNDFLKRINEIPFRLRMHIERVNDAVSREVFLNSRDDGWVVVAIIQGAGTRKKVVIRSAGHVLQGGAFCRGENDGKRTAIISDTGFESFENVLAHKVSYALIAKSAVCSTE